VFVGIYASAYGWVAPDEEVSGLEDEYNLARHPCRSSSTSSPSQTRDDGSSS
jgi:hypothetical protein